MNLNPALIETLIAVTFTLAAGVMAWRAHFSKRPQTQRVCHVLLACAGGSSLLAWVHMWWQTGWGDPLANHAMGLLLACGLLSSTLLYLQTRPRMFMLSLFGPMVILLLLAWAFCGQIFTLRMFDTSEWKLLKWMHLSSVYAGVSTAGLAAIIAVYYLIAERRLKKRIHLEIDSKDASLHTLEAYFVGLARVGFALLSFGLISGILLLVQDYPPAEWDWSPFYPIMALALITWFLYALILHPPILSMQHRTAAWLCIAGFVLTLLSFSLVMWRVTSHQVPNADTTTETKQAEGTNG